MTTLSTTVDKNFHLWNMSLSERDKDWIVVQEVQAGKVSRLRSVSAKVSGAYLFGDLQYDW